jgi:hypothetical protein
MVKGRVANAPQREREREEEEASFEMDSLVGAPQVCNGEHAVSRSPIPRRPSFRRPSIELRLTLE